MFNNCARRGKPRPGVVVSGPVPMPSTEAALPPTRSSAAPETAASAAPVTVRSSPALQRASLAAPVQPGGIAPPVFAAADPVSHIGKPCPGLAECPERPRLVRRLYDAAEREIAAVEASLGRNSATAARRLGALAATLDRLAAFDRKAQAGRDHAGEQNAPPVTAPVDAEAWAEEIAAQLREGQPRKGGDAA
jgi:hypothetical protein